LQARQESRLGKSLSRVNRGAIDLVGPKGYVHGWRFVGVPSPGAHIPKPSSGKRQKTTFDRDVYDESRQSGATHAQSKLAATAGRVGTQQQFETHLANVNSLKNGESRKVAKGTVKKVGTDYHVTIDGKTMKYRRYSDDATRALMSGRHRGSAEKI
jgi:hypothetical protein